MAFLREVEREEEEGQHGQKDGVDEIEQALEEAAIGQEIERELEIAGVAQGESVVGKEAGVGFGAEGGVDDADDESERSFGGIEIQVIEARDGLIFVGRISMRSLGLDLLAIDEDFGSETGRAEL